MNVRLVGAPRPVFPLQLGHVPMVLAIRKARFWKLAATPSSLLRPGAPCMLVTGTWWLLRELGPVAIELSDVQVDEHAASVTLSVCVSKTTPHAEGACRTRVCSCPLAAGTEERAGVLSTRWPY